MQALIVSQIETLNLRIRQVLLKAGYVCPPSHIISLDRARDRAVEVQPDLIVMVLSPDPAAALRSLGALRSAFQARYLAVGPVADSKFVLAAVRGGAEDYIDEADLESELVSALDRTKMTTGAAGKIGQVIAVLAPSGGSGSSTLASSVAAVLAKESKSVLLVDLKLESGDLAALLDLRPTHTLADLCQNAARMDRIMLEGSLVRHPSGLQLLAPPLAIADARFVTPEGIQQALALARKMFSYVIVDLDHSFREEQTQVLSQADVILLVLRLEFTALRNTHKALDYLKQNGIESHRVRVVVNRHGQAKEIPAGKAEEALGVKIEHFIPEDAKTVNRANNSGIPVVLESPSAKISKSLIRLAESVNGRH
jgi:pilus assembly protein CpaE